MLQKCLRIVEEIATPSALYQNPIDGSRGQQRFIADGGDDVRQGLIIVGNLHRPHFPFHVADPGLLDVNIGSLGHQTGFGDMGHFLKGFDAVLHQLLCVNAHPVGGFLLDLAPQLQELRGEHDLFVEPYHHITGGIPHRGLPVGIGDNLLKTLSGSFIFFRQVKGSVLQSVLHGILDLTGAGDIPLLLKMLQQLRSFLVGDGMFLYGSDCTGDSNNCLCCLFSGRTVFNLAHDFRYGAGRFGDFP